MRPGWRFVSSSAFTAFQCVISLYWASRILVSNCCMNMAAGVLFCFRVLSSWMATVTSAIGLNVSLSWGWNAAQFAWSGGGGKHDCRDLDGPFHSIVFGHCVEGEGHLHKV